MTKTLTFVAILLTTLGCVDVDKEDDRDSCKVSFTFTEDYHGSQGLYVKEMLDKSDVAYVSYSEMENLYRDVEKCVAGNNTPAPTVEFSSFKHYNIGNNWGVYMAASQIVYINTDRTDRNCYSDRETLKHEFVHHVLYMNGKDHSHSSAKFAQCDALGVKVCDGTPCGN